MADSDVQQHLLRNFGRFDTIEKIEDDMLELTRSVQYLQSQARPTELGAYLEGKGNDGRQVPLWLRERLQEVVG